MSQSYVNKRDKSSSSELYGFQPDGHFSTSLFHRNYRPLIWLGHSRSLNNYNNSIQKRAVRIVFNDNVSFFDGNKSGLVRVHHRNLQFLPIEIYKALHNLSPPFMSELL